MAGDLHTPPSPRTVFRRRLLQGGTAAVQGLQHGLQHLVLAPGVRQWTNGLEEYLTTTPTLRCVEVSREEWEQGTAAAHSSHGLAEGDEGGAFTAISGVNEDEGLFEPHHIRSGYDPDAVCPPPSQLPSQQSSLWHGKAHGLAQARTIFGWPVISCYTRSYAIWALFILFVDLTYSAFFLPISIGFQIHNQENWAAVVDLVAGAFFAVELLLGPSVSFVQTYQAQKREVKEGWLVAEYYLRHSSFWQDLLSTAIWLMEIVMLIVHQATGKGLGEGVIAAFQLIRIIRLIRFVSVLNNVWRMTISAGSGTVIPGLEVPHRVKHGVNVLYSLLVMLNFMACLWNWMAILEGLDNTWLNTIPALVRQYSADGASVLTVEELAAVPASRRYLCGFSFALVTLATVGYGDIVPSTSLETAVNIVQLAIGVLTFGLIMGSIADLVSNSSEAAKKRQLYQEKISAVNVWMKNSRMPRPLMHKVRVFYSDVWSQHSSAMADATALFSELPHNLRQDIAWELNRPLFYDIPLFTGLDHSALTLFASCMTPANVTPGQTICSRGDVADRLWLLHEGRVQVVSDVDVVAVLEAPAIFGEAALLQLQDAAFCLRPCGYRSATSCSLWYAELKALMPLLGARPEVLDLLCQRVWAHVSQAEAPRSRQPSDAHQQHVKFANGEPAAATAAQGAHGAAAVSAHAPWVFGEGGGSKPSSHAPSRQGSALQLVATSAWRASAGHSSGDASGTPTATGAAADGGGAALVTRGELQRLRSEVLERLDLLVQSASDPDAQRRSSSEA